MNGGVRAQCYRRDQHDGVGAYNQQHRIRQPLSDQLSDWYVADEGHAPVTSGHAAQPAQILDRHWLVEAVVMAESEDVFRRQRRVNRVRGQRIPGYLDDPEQNDRDQQQERDGFEDTPAYIPPHG